MNHSETTDALVALAHSDDSLPNTNTNNALQRSASGTLAPHAPTDCSVIPMGFAVSGTLEQPGGDVLVQGTHTGPVTLGDGTAALGRVHVAASGALLGDVMAESLLIEGEFDGKATVQRLQTRRSGHVASVSDLVGVVVCKGATLSADVSAPSNNIKPIHHVVNGEATGNWHLTNSCAVTIAPGAKFCGHLTGARAVVIDGHFEGDLVCRFVELRPGCVVHGSITCPSDGVTWMAGARVRAAMHCDGDAADGASVAALGAH